MYPKTHFSGFLSDYKECSFPHNYTSSLGTDDWCQVGPTPDPTNPTNPTPILFTNVNQNLATQIEM